MCMSDAQSVDNLISSVQNKVRPAEYFYYVSVSFEPMCLPFDLDKVF